MRKKRLVSVFVFLATLGMATSSSGAQVYGYTDESGVLILSNVPSDTSMRLIVEGNPEDEGRVWRYSGQYDTLILKAASVAGLDSALIKAVIAIESGFNRFARSHKGAMGLMQLMPDTARRYGVSNPYDAWQNIKAGSVHLRDLLDEFNDVHLSLAAYNAGATPVRKYKTIPPYRETRDYVRKVMAIYRAGSKISITKGGQTYSISRKGGKTTVQPSPGTAAPVDSKSVRRTSWDDNMSLGQIAAAARQQTQTSSSRAIEQAPSVPSAEADNTSKKRRTLAAAEAGTEAEAQMVGKSDSPQANAFGFELSSPSGNGGDSAREGPVFYRYKDDNGVIYITRNKPSHTNFEILKR